MINDTDIDRKLGQDWYGVVLLYINKRHLYFLVREAELAAQLAALDVELDCLAAQ